MYGTARLVTDSPSTVNRYSETRAEPRISDPLAFAAGKTISQFEVLAGKK